MKREELKNKLNKGFDQISPHSGLDMDKVRKAGSLSESEIEEIFEVGSKNPTSHYKYSISFAVSFAALLLMVCTMFFMIRNSSYSQVIISVNPSVELKVKDGEVVRVKARNNDAKEIVKDIPTPQKLENVIDTVIKKIDEKGYFKVDGNEIKITVKGKNKKELQKNVSKQAQLTCSFLEADVPITVNDSVIKTTVITEAETTVSTTEATTEEKTTEAAKTTEKLTEETTTENTKNANELKEKDSDNKDDHISPEATTEAATESSQPATEAPADTSSEKGNSSNNKDTTKEKKEKKQKDNNSNKDKDNNNNRNKDKDNDNNMDKEKNQPNNDKERPKKPEKDQSEEK